MKIKQIKKIINNFVSQDNNDSLIIKGKYGVGKTFFWNELLKTNNIPQSKSKVLDVENEFTKIKKPSYAYISLFGIDSLENLKNTILAEIVSSDNINKVTGRLDNATKNLFTRFEKIPHVEKFTGGIITALAFQGIRNALICFDDIDRKSSKLELSEIVGLATMLKEQHDCKIIFILNENVLQSEMSSDIYKDYRKQIEKLADFEIDFAPTPEEIIELIFPKEYKNQEIIKEICIRFDVTNIRILKRIKIFIEGLSEFLKTIQKEVLIDIYKSLIFFVLVQYDKTEEIPTFEEIEKFNLTNFNVNTHFKRENTEEDKKIYESLKKYEFTGSTDLDKDLIGYVRKGYVNEQSFSEKLTIRDKAIIAQEGVNKYRQAWRLYNNTFKCNQEEFLEKLTEGYLANIEYLEIRNLTETIRTLRQLGADENANKLADEYVERIFDENNMLLMRRGHMDFNVEDVYLKQKLLQKLDEQKSNRTLKEVLERFGSSSPHYLEDVDFLKSVTEDDFYEYFKSYQPKQVVNEIQFYIHDLYNQVMACLDFVDYPMNAKLSE